MTYYEDNAKDYIAKTINVNMKDTYDFFLKYAKPKSRLIDIGFGSGRDMLYFKSLGFDVFGIDPTTDFYEEAKIKGLNVDCCEIMDLANSIIKYDLIWASAVLHHIPKALLNQLFKICNDLLEVDGIMYFSVKYGDFEGYDELGRYFNYLTEKTMNDYLKDTGFKVIDIKITEDNLKRENKWLNVILKKVKI